MGREPIRLAVVGAGARARVYANFVRAHPELARVVAVADPDRPKRDKFADDFGIPAEGRFETHADFLPRPGIADAVINGTSDRQHYPTGLPLLEAGFHMVLEKPIASTEAEVRGLIAAAAKHRRVVVVGHVLRYAPFYATVKRLLTEGRIGRVVGIRTAEAVSYHHMACAFVTGGYHREETTSPMLMAKCCHDLDLIAWYMAGVGVRRVASFGSLLQYRKENAPAGSTERCLDGCAVEARCSYSARRMYVDHSLAWGWPFHIQPGKKWTREEKLEALRTELPAGKCVWRSDNNVVDHQSVLVEFADGVTATHDMWGGTSRPVRSLHIYGSAGELQGELEEGLLTVREHDPDGPGGFRSEVLDMRKISADALDPHGGGDHRLMADFLAPVGGEHAGHDGARIEESLMGHVIGFAAERARKEGRVVEVA